MYKRYFISILSLLFLLFFTPPAFAHVVVKPDQVGIATFQTFTVNVPSEKEVSTTQLRLVIPQEVNYVTPTVKPGWTIDVKKVGEGEEAKVTEITWTGGEVPGGQRDEFSFSAQTPAKPTILVWKAYQTYANGEEIAWDANPEVMRAQPQDSEGDEETEGSHPFSQTKIVNDLKKQPALSSQNNKTENQTVLVAYIALALAAVSLGLQLQRR